MLIVRCCADNIVKIYLLLLYIYPDMMSRPLHIYETRWCNVLRDKRIRKSLVKILNK